ncbi:dihydroorotate dehydrogenase [Paenibacillus taihuensis]|uniref:Dihydroorotate dehydrogenase n=1 Tax=Paenibacillus taihuensis TaxID=1156355 RepID=A0A3D9Q6Y0_9BACL|nr:hypothetical protein [Paenibacillus taihuensis]REE56433.1 dihydroorotate dehydrogenase [Paenibacillus taihuensis]
MPDWSYQTLFRPLLFRLPGRIARSFTLGAIGTLSRLPLGSFVIRTLGHMEPAPLLRSKIGGVELATPVGLAGSADPAGTAHRAMAQFGFGFIELGPVMAEPLAAGEVSPGAGAAPIRLDAARERIVYPAYAEHAGGGAAAAAAAAAARLAKPGHALPQLVRLTPLPGSTPEQALPQLLPMMRQLRQAGAAGFFMDALQQPLDPHGTAWLLEQLRIAARQAEPNLQDALLFLYIPHDAGDSRLAEILQAIDLTAWTGAVIGESRSPDTGELVLDPQDKHSCLAKLRLLRELPTKPAVDFTLIAAAGIYEPQDALDTIEAGASYVMLHAGLVFAGPGLPKRVNEAILHEKVKQLPAPEPVSFWRHWGWMCLLGIGMILGGLLAWMIAATTVLLPYDEAFLGLKRDALHHINHRLLHFMSHDRITLAGTMISIGVLYYQLSRYGLQFSIHWARITLLVSCTFGFLSFFLYLGYGYFDPLHAMVAIILLPMFLLSMRKNPDRPFRGAVNLRNDAVWRRAMYGQCCMVALGFALVIGSITISGFGITKVFVPQDLSYMDTTAAQLRAANPHLVPLIAHDRAGFGGALFSDALALLIMSLWGLQQGQRWLWWTYLLGGSPAFIAAFTVHMHIGYTDFVHLSPAVFALALYIGGLVLLYPYLMPRLRRRSQ